MTAAVQPIEAWAAVSPDGVIAVDTVCFSQGHAYASIPYCGTARGWRVIRVRIVPVEDGDADQR